MFSASTINIQLYRWQIGLLAQQMKRLNRNLGSFARPQLPGKNQAPAPLAWKGMGLIGKAMGVDTQVGSTTLRRGIARL